MNESGYRYCDHCKTPVPVERRFPKTTLVLLLLMLVSAVITLLAFPRFIFIFILLPFGLGLWKRAEYCTICGRRIIPGQGSQPRSKVLD